jgi:hypothetical protein
VPTHHGLGPPQRSGQLRSTLDVSTRSKPCRTAVEARPQEFDTSLCPTNRPQTLRPVSETNAAPTGNAALKQPKDPHRTTTTRADKQPPVATIWEAPKLDPNHHLCLAEPHPNTSGACGQFACAAQLHSGDRGEFVLFRGHCEIVSKNWALRRIGITNRSDRPRRVPASGQPWSVTLRGHQPSRCPPLR